MKDINANKGDDSIDTFLINEEAVLMNFSKNYSSIDIVLEALKKVSKERKINLRIKNKKDFTELDSIIEINKFSVQVVYSGLSSDEITIPLKRWNLVSKYPQIILAVCIDEENNIVLFKGILTSNEFQNFLNEDKNNSDIIQLSLDDFKGGINRLFSFVEILNYDALSDQAGIEKNNYSYNIFDYFLKSKKEIGFCFLALAAFIISPNLFSPKLTYELASIQATKLSLKPKTRSLENVVEVLSICLISPDISSTTKDNQKTLKMSINKPILFSSLPLNQIRISKDGTELWNLESSPDFNIKGPIRWPIKAMNADEEYILSFRPKGASIGEFLEIKIRTNSNNSLVKIESLIDSLGKSKNKWIKEIDKQLNEDKNIAYALLFSDKLPKTKVLIKAKEALITNSNCN